MAAGKYLLRVWRARCPVAAHTGTGVAAASREVPGGRTSTGRNGAMVEHITGQGSLTIL